MRIHLLALGMLVLAGHLASPEAARAAPIPPGTDLTAVTTEAADGATITLGPGEYPGQIVVKNKSLTVTGDPGGETVLSGDVQALVIVLDKGRLTLSNVTFKTRSKDGLAVYVRGGSAAVSNSRTKATMQPAFYVEAGSLDVAGCRFDETLDDAIRGVKGAKITVRDSEFSGIKAYGVNVQEGSQAVISGSRFQHVERAGVLAIEGATAVIQNSQFLEISKDGVVIKDGSQGKITGSSFDALDGIAVVGIQDARVSVVGSRFTHIKMGAIHAEKGGEMAVANSAFADIGEEAIVGLDVGSLTVRESVFERVKGAAVVLEGGKALEVQGSRFTDVRAAVAVNKSGAQATVSRNIITKTADEQTAIWLETSGKVVVTGNLVFDAHDGIGLVGNLESPAEITGNAVVNARATALYVEAQFAGEGDAVRIAGNHVIGAGKLGLLVANAPNVAVSGNLILSRGESGIHVQNGSSARLDKNVVFASKVAVHFHTTAGEGNTLGTDILLGGEAGGVYPAAGPHRTIPSLKVAFLLSESGVAESLKELAAGAMDAAKEATAADFAGLQAVYAPLFEEAARLREQTAAMSVLTLETVDAVGQPFFAKFELLTLDGQPISEHDAGNPIAVVSPGTYVVEPSFDPALAEEVTVEAGGTKAVQVKAREYLALSFEKYDWSTSSTVKTTLPLRLKDGASMRRVLAGSPPAAIPRRPGATREQLDQALRLAWERLPDTIELNRAAGEEYMAGLDNLRGPPGARIDADLEKLAQKVGRSELPLFWVLRIMGIAGDGADAKRLIDLAVAQEDTTYRHYFIRIAARIENRLGMLDSGAVAALLASEDPGIGFEVATMLHSYGLSGGDEMLLARLGDPKDDGFTYRAAAGLLDTDHPAVLEAMRSLVRKTIGEIARIKAEHEGKEGSPQYPYQLRNAGWRAATYLLAYGNESDWKLVSGFPFQEDSMLFMAKLVSDPRPFIDFKLGLTAGGSLNYDPKGLAEFCPALRTLPPRVAAEVDRYIEGILVSIGIERNVGQFGAKPSAMVTRWRYDIAKGGCRASRTVAELVYHQFSKRFKGENWIPRIWEQDKLIGEFAAGNSQLDEQMEYFPHAKLVEALADGKAGDYVPHADLFLAYHLIARRTCKPDMCAFALINPSNPPGALTAVVAVRSEFVEERLRVGLSFDLGAYTGGDLATMMDPPTRSFRNYLATRGKALVGKVQVQRGDEVIALVEAGTDSRGDFVYEAALGERDLSDLYLHVELQIFDQIWPLDFALFANDYAKSLRRGITRAARAEQVAKANADDAGAWIAWGDALQDIGRLTAAREKYEHVLSRKPEDVSLWFAVSDMFSSRKLYGEAREVIERAAAANPENPDMLLELANLSYREGAYGEAAEAYAKLSAVEPNDPRWKWWQATNRFLAGEYGEASKFFRSASTDYQAGRTAVLRFLSARLAGSDDAAEAEAKLKALHEAQMETVEGLLYGVLVNAIPLELAMEAVEGSDELCRANVYVGYRHLLAGEAEPARKRFSAALDGCRANRFEHRMAGAELKRLGPAE